MNYNEHTPGVLAAGDNLDLASEPDCSPHPLDIMAIYALYQTVD